MVSFTVKVIIVTYFLFVGIQLLFLYAYGGVRDESVNDGGSGFYGHNYCGTFFIDITRDNSFADEDAYLKAMEPDTEYDAADIGLIVIMGSAILILMKFLHRADKQTLLEKRSAWLVTAAGILYAAGCTVAELERLYPDTGIYKGIMAGQSWYPQIVYGAYGIAVIALAYGAVLFNYEQTSREKSTAFSSFGLRALSFFTVIAAFGFMAGRLYVRVREILDAAAGKAVNARLPFYSSLLELPVGDAVSQEAYLNVLVFRLVKDAPVFIAAAIAVIMLVRFMDSAADGEFNSKKNRRCLKIGALALAVSSVCLNLLGLKEVEMLRESFTGIYATAQYTIAVRAGCEPMLYTLLMLAAEIYLQAIPDSESAEEKAVKPKRSWSLERHTKLSGTSEEKVTRCLEKAGWYKGRSVDITPSEEWYSQWDIVLPEAVKDIFREYYGLAEAWWFNDDDGRDCDFEICLFPGVSGENYLSDIDSRGRFADQNMAEAAADEPLIFIGHAGYNYPDFLFASESGEIWTKEGKHYDSIFSVVMSHFKEHEKWKTVKMKQYAEWK